MGTHSAPTAAAQAAQRKQTECIRPLRDGATLCAGWRPARSGTPSHRCPSGRLTCTRQTSTGHAHSNTCRQTLRCSHPVPMRRMLLSSCLVAELKEHPQAPRMRRWVRPTSTSERGQTQSTTVRTGFPKHHTLLQHSREDGGERGQGRPRAMRLTPVLGLGAPSACACNLPIITEEPQLFDDSSVHRQRGDVGGQQATTVGPLFCSSSQSHGQRPIRSTEYRHMGEPKALCNLWRRHTTRTQVCVSEEGRR